MEINNINLAKAIDFINGWTINYYTNDISEKPDPYIIQDALWNKLGIDHKYFEHALRIMRTEGFIEYLSNDDTDALIRTFRHTDRALLLYLNGGMEQKLERDRVDRELAQKQVQSVITTNTIQKIVLVLTTGLAALSLFVSWLTYNKTDDVKILTPIQVQHSDTINVIELTRIQHDSIKIKK